ncbi:hypothetical protein SLEP1_g14954 [Rubroshorea leprosula]|uniref:Ribosomal protein L33 n=1 Tax=Rubroshorea leprosula TaxID=152421 RepID=A0AAV5IV95_9ROSI|nr:hypothetical protein SLEP1_g14954 [Rubroshorea leprosula]
MTIHLGKRRHTISAGKRRFVMIRICRECILTSKAC